MCKNVAGSLLNFHEGVRTQATSWIPFAWMPVYDDKLAPKRDALGFNSHTTRRVRLEHEALSMSSRTGKLELGTQCICTGEGRFCTH